LNGLVLIADGDHQRGNRLAAICADLDLETRVATHGAAALEIALAEPPEVLVVQLGLPLIDGVQLGGILHANPRTNSVELIFLADAGAEAAQTGLDGEIIAPPADLDALARRVQTLIEKQRSSAEEPDPGSEESGGVEGQLSQLPLADLLQLFHVSQKTGVVEVRRYSGRPPVEAGRVLLRRGDIVHAEVGLVAGAKALYRLLAWDRGEFNFQPGPVILAATLEKPTRVLLRDGKQHNEEWARRAANLPPMDAYVRLKVQRASLPMVIHPLTQEVLLVLEAYSRVEDVVDHCSFPDYPVLRTLHTLIDRGMVDLRNESIDKEREAPTGFFSGARGKRLQEWLGSHRVRDAKLLVVAGDPAAAREFGRMIERLPGGTPGSHEQGDPIERVGTLARLAVDEQVGIELVEVPADPRFAALWPLAGNGALGILLLLSGSVAAAVEIIRPAAEVLCNLPRARIFHLLMLEKGETVGPEALRENLSLFDDSSLFLIPKENTGTAEVLLREMFVRILP
jgi:2-phospho-L-lactate guanylyltransferase (CobY/MobA/RfbA family)